MYIFIGLRDLGAGPGARDPGRGPGLGAIPWGGTRAPGPVSTVLRTYIPYVLNVKNGGTRVAHRECPRRYRWPGQYNRYMGPYLLTYVILYNKYLILCVQYGIPTHTYSKLISKHLIFFCGKPPHLVTMSHKLLSFH